MRSDGYDLFPVQAGSQIKGGAGASGTVRPGSSQLLYTQAGSALSTVANTASLTAFAAPFASPTIAPNALGVVGAYLNIHIWGVYGTTGTPTLTLSMRFDDVTNAGFPLQWIPAFTCPGVTGAPWDASFGILTKTVGSSGTTCGVGGPVTLGNNASFANGVSQVGPFVFNGALDTTVSHTISIGVTWGAMSSSNTITLQGIAVTLAYPVSTGAMS